MLVSKFAYFSLFAVLYVVVGTSNVKNSRRNFLAPKQPETTTLDTSTETVESTTELTSESTSEDPNTTSETSENSTVNSATSSKSSDVTTEPPLVLPPTEEYFPPYVNCFIDEKMKREVEIFHVIGVRNFDSRLMIGDKDFDFDFFDKPIDITDPMNAIPSDDVTMMTSDNPITSEKSTTSESTTSESSTSSESTSPGNSTDDSSTTSSNFTFDSTTSDDGLNSTDPSSIRFSKATTTSHLQDFNTPLDVIITNNITVAWDESLQRFHFLIPDKAFRHYVVTYDDYQKHITEVNKSVEFSKLNPPLSKSWNLSEPYTCHYNVKNNNSICISIDDRLVTVSIFGKDTITPKENTFSLPNYLSFDKFFSYSDSEGTDYILIHHKGQWIYRINYKMYLLDQNMFFKVFHLLTPDSDFQFEDFEHADEFGLVTKYVDFEGNNRYYYSLFSEVSGLATYCVRKRPIDGRLMILGRKKIEQEQSIAESLLSINPNLYTEPHDVFEFPTMLRFLFYCAATYLSIFLATQFIPNRRPLIFKDLRHADREIQRLAPVIETIMSKVHKFLEGTKKNGGKKKEKI